MAPPPPELMEELVEEVLLRFPPEDPASLVHAALVCKLWCRLVCGAAFLRRFRKFHFHGGMAPLLGVLYHDSCNPIGILRVPTMAYFVPTTSFRPVPAAARRKGWGVTDARHGRVLVYWSGGLPDGRGFSIWDPVTDKQQDLPVGPLLPPFYMDSWSTAAVTCAATVSGNCDHLDCRRGPFLVVVMDIDHNKMHLSVYSSEDGAWSKLTVSEGPKTNALSRFNNMPGVLVGCALYFLVHLNNKILNHEIVKYNLATRQVSTIHLPSKFRHLKRSIVLMTDDDGRLGFVSSSVKDKLKLWSIVAGPDGDLDFVLSRVISLKKVLPSDALIKNSICQVNGFVGGGASRVLLIRTCDGLYSMEINSSQVKKVENYCGNGNIVPYISFCTPTSKIQH